MMNTTNATMTADQIETLFASSDALLDRARRTGDRELLARSNRVFDAACAALKAAGLRREVVSTGVGTGFSVVRVVR